MEKKAGYVIEEGRRLSESTLWDLQRAFYDRMGVAAWSSGKIPSYVTNNPFVAGAYAKVLLGFLRDCGAGQMGEAASSKRALDPDQPVFVLELGAGSGRLGYLLLRKLLALRNIAPLKEVKFCYVMSDVAESNLRFWNDHPALQPLVDGGVLDFAIFDPERQREITLFRSGLVLSSETIRNPVIVIANYLFDALSQDSFRAEDGALFEGLYTVSSDLEPNMADPELLQQIKISTTYRPIGADYYQDDLLNQILNGYREGLGDSSFLLPLGALRCLANLMSLAQGKLLLLAADKGYVSQEQILERDVSLEVEGMRSMTGMAVNCHALRHYFDRLGGQTLHSASWDTRLVISAFCAGANASDFPETRAAFLEAVDQFSPYHYYVLIKRSREEGDETSIESILALLRLSQWDPQLLLWHAQGIREQLPTASAAVRRELSGAMVQVWDNHFAIGEKEDLAFEIGTILQKMGQPADALNFYERSRQLSGAHHATEFNSGICSYQLGNVAQALFHINQALELKADYQPAVEWKAHIESERGTGGTG